MTLKDTNVNMRDEEGGQEQPRWGINMKTQMKIAAVTGACALLGALIGSMLTGYFGLAGARLAVAQAADSMAAQSAHNQAAMFAEQLSRHIDVVVDFRFLLGESASPPLSELRDKLCELEKRTYEMTLYGGGDFLKATADLHNALVALSSAAGTPQSERWATAEDALVIWLRVARGEMRTYGVVSLPAGKPADKDIDYLWEALRAVREVQVQPLDAPDG